MGIVCGQRCAHLFLEGLGPLVQVHASFQPQALPASQGDGNAQHPREQDTSRQGRILCAVELGESRGYQAEEADHWTDDEIRFPNAADRDGKQ